MKDGETAVDQRFYATLLDARLISKCARVLSNSYIPCRTPIPKFKSSRRNVDIGSRQRDCFFSSEHLQHLHVVRRQTMEQHLRENLNLQIQQVHRQELRQWKSNQLNTSWATPSGGKISVIICLGLPNDAA